MKLKTAFITGLFVVFCLIGCKKYEPKQLPLPSQMVVVEVLATYVNEKGLWITAIKIEDNTTCCELHGKFGKEGFKFNVWRRGGEIFLQDPNLD